jgi:hypothetical protein
MAVPPCQLRDEDRAEREPTSVDLSLGRYLTVGIKDAFEVLVQILDRSGA